MSETAFAAEKSSTWWAVDPLLMQPDAGKVRLFSPKATKRLVVDPEIAQLLLLAHNGVDSSDALPGWSTQRFRSVTEKLATYGYLTDGTGGEATTEPWRHWGPLAWAFHEAMWNPGTADGSEPATPGYLNGEQIPSTFRRVQEQPVLLLPRLSSLSRMSFVEVLEGRRTHRHFGMEPVLVEHLAEILRYSFGPLRFVDTGPLGVLQLRAVASGGARHESEAYVYVFNVAGVEPGLYLYDTLRHGLVPVRPGLLRDEAERLTLEQNLFRDAAFGVFTSAISERMSWKYRNPGAYRVLWQNVGHVAQVFSMMCTAMGLGASLTGGIRVAEARQALRIESPAELVTFAMSCGHPRRRNDGLPMAPEPPRSPFVL